MKPPADGYVGRGNCQLEYHRDVQIELTCTAKYLTFRNGFLDFLNFDLTKSLDLQECPARSCMDGLQRIESDKSVSCSSNKWMKTLLRVAGPYCDCVIAIRLQF